MNVYFTTFIGIGNRTSLDIKLKSGNKILYSATYSESKDLEEFHLFDMDALGAFFTECSSAIHALGLQKLSAWMDMKVKVFDDEYSATWEHDAMMFIRDLNNQSFTVDPIY